MDFRPLFRPWAMVIAFLFVAVAVVDFIDSLRREPEALPRLIEAGALEFTHAGDEDVSVAQGGQAGAIEVDLAGESVVIKRPGRLTVPFSMDERIDALILDYRFEGGGGTAKVAIERAPPGESGFVGGIEEHIASETHRGGRVRFPLHGHEGAFVLSVDADLETPTGELHFISMRLVEEN